MSLLYSTVNANGHQLPTLSRMVEQLFSIRCPAWESTVGQSCRLSTSGINQPYLFSRTVSACDIGHVIPTDRRPGWVFALSGDLPGLTRLQIQDVNSAIKLFTTGWSPTAENDLLSIG